MKFINDNNSKITEIFKLSGSISKLMAVKLSENKVFIAFNEANNNYYLHAIVCTIDGTTITAGTDTKLSNTAHMGDYISSIALSENKVFIAHSYSENYNLRGIVCTIDGTTITAGTDKSLVNQQEAGRYMSTVKLSENKIFITFGYNSETYNLRGIVCTIDGTTITAGTNTKLSTVYYSGMYTSLIALSESKIFIVHSYSPNKNLYAMICTIDGTTITAGTDIELNNKENSGGSISSIALSENKVFIVHSSLYAMICTIDGTTITAGTNTKLASNAYGIYLLIAILSNNRLLIMYPLGSNYIAYICICNINDNTLITVETNRPLVSSSYTASLPSLISLTENKILITLISDVLTIGGIINPDLKDTAIQLQKSNDTIKGISKTAGTAGQMVQVYVPSI